MLAPRSTPPEQFAIDGILREMTKDFFDSFSRDVVTIIGVFECLRGETTLLIDPSTERDLAAV